MSWQKKREIRYCSHRPRMPSFVQSQVGSLKQKSTKLGHTVRVAAKRKAKTQSHDARFGSEHNHRARNASHVLLWCQLSWSGQLISCRNSAQTIWKHRLKCSTTPVSQTPSANGLRPGYTRAEAVITVLGKFHFAQYISDTHFQLNHIQSWLYWAHNVTALNSIILKTR